MGQRSSWMVKDGQRCPVHHLSKRMSLYHHFTASFYYLECSRLLCVTLSLRWCCVIIVFTFWWDDDRMTRISTFLRGQQAWWSWTSQWPRLTPEVHDPKPQVPLQTTTRPSSSVVQSSASLTFKNSTLPHILILACTFYKSSFICQMFWKFVF